MGHTLEAELGLTENNLAAADIKGVEIKAHREGAASLITLFTFNRKAWIMPPLEAIHNYGSFDGKGRKGMYYTMSFSPNSAGLFLVIDDGKIFVRHISGESIASWSLPALAERFAQKIPALLLVSARVEERDGAEYFHYYRARLMKGTSPELLADLFRNGDLSIDLRLHDKGASARNHGTGFRVLEKNLPKLFTRVIDI